MRKSEIFLALAAGVLLAGSPLSGYAAADTARLGEGEIASQPTNPASTAAVAATPPATALKAKPADKAPITIEAEYLSFSDQTGDVYAQGQVQISQNQGRISSEEIRANTKQNQVWVDGEAQIEQPVLKANIVATKLQYNYLTHIGNMQSAKGIVGSQHVSGADFALYPDHVMAYQGTATKCPAQVPDYHISADKIEIWPDDKMIAYNAKFWIKNTVIYSTSKYQASLKKQEHQAFPRAGYSSEHGVFIKQEFQAPLGETDTVYVDLGYYSKRGLKPVYGYIHPEKNYSVEVVQGDFLDSDDNWITKKPEVRLTFEPKRLGELPWQYNLSATYGQWSDEQKSSWHQAYKLYFTRDAVKLTPSLTWYNGLGVEYIRESYDGSTQNIFRYNTSLQKTVSPKLSLYGGYNYTKNNKGLFAYDATTLAREVYGGFTYRLDKMNAVSYSVNYDLENNRLDKRTYTWHRSLHCWQLDISYKPLENNRISWNLTTARW